MKHTKHDFQIVLSDNSFYTVEVRKPFLKFFKKWVPVTYQEAENSEEKLLVFDSFQAAIDFIEIVTN